MFSPPPIPVPPIGLDGRLAIRVARPSGVRGRSLVIALAVELNHTIAASSSSFIFVINWWPACGCIEKIS